MNAGIQKRHIAGVQHLAQRTGPTKVDRHIGSGVQGIRQIFGAGSTFLHHAHKLRQTWSLLHCHIQCLNLRHQLGGAAFRLFHRTGIVIKYRGERAAQSLVHLPVFAVVLDLRQRLGIVPGKGHAVTGIQARCL